MKQSRKNWQIGAAVGILTLLVFAAALWIRYAPGILRPLSVAQGQPPGQGASYSPLPLPSPAPPTEEIIVITPGPDGVVNLPPATPGQIYAFASPTPFPTPTPRPTPTRRPGPTATVMPLPKPADTAQGYLLYAVPDDSNQSGSIWGRTDVDTIGTLVPNSATQLREENVELTYPQPSPDGAYILFLQPGGGAGIPYLYESSSQSVHPLFNHPELFDEYNIEQFDQIVGLPFGWHPDSKHVLFWAWTTLDAGLWLVNVETGTRTVIELNQDPPPQGAAVSPDGQRIAYAIVDGGFTHVNIVFADGTLDKNISSIQVLHLFGWSPDGKQLLVSGAYRLADTPNKGEVKSEGPLWILNPDNMDLQPLQIPLITNWPFDARWSPDGRFIAAVGLTPGGHFPCTDSRLPAEKADSCMYEGTSIYIQDVPSGEARELSPGILPVWSPDGSMLAFLSNRTGNPEVWTIRIDGTGLQQITFDGKAKRFSLAWITVRGEKK